MNELASSELHRFTHKKGLKEGYLLGQKHSQQIFGLIPFIKLQNDILHLNGEKNDEK